MKSLLYFVAVCGILITPTAFSESYTLDSFAVGPSITSTGGTYALDANIDEADSNSSIGGGSYSLDAGFWAMTAIQTPGAPLLTIRNTTTNTVVVSWPVSVDQFELQQASKFSVPSWSTAPQTVNTSGSTRFIVVNPPTGSRFYRLRQTGTSGFLITNLNDSGPGSLRAAVQAATNNTRISFFPGLSGVITLTNGELSVITSNLSISGPGAAALAISGNSTSRVFNVTGGSAIISGLAIRDGKARGTTNGSNGYGGGVYNRVSLVLSNCAVVANVTLGFDGAAGNNTVGGAGGSGLGGGIYNTGTLALVNCTLALNEARGANGGRGSDSAGNFGFRGGNGGSGLGGALCNDGVLSITNCTFVANSVFGGNGGNGGDGGLSIGNGGTGGTADGAGLLSRLSCQLANVTVAGGAAQPGFGGTGGTSGAMGVAHGSGICTTAGTASLVNTLLAQNSLGTGGQATNGPDASGTFASQGYNLIGITNGSGGWIASDRLGSSVAPLNPMLDAVQDNGGWTATMALLPGSPAIDQGKAIGLLTDQRGLLRPYDYSGVANASGGNGSDIGAFESNP